MRVRKGHLRGPPSDAGNRTKAAFDRAFGSGKICLRIRAGHPTRHHSPCWFLFFSFSLSVCKGLPGVSDPRTRYSRGNHYRDETKPHDEPEDSPRQPCARRARLPDVEQGCKRGGGAPFSEARGRLPLGVSRPFRVAVFPLCGVLLTFLGTASSASLRARRSPVRRRTTI